MTDTIAIADAKANLSAVVKTVQDKGATYILTVRGVPSAMITPIPQQPPKTLKAKGVLSGLRPKAGREEERESYREALEARYANVS